MLYKGKVEINEDPKNLDRIKVRIFGFHPKSSVVANQDLQWVDPIMLANESIVPNVGDIVYCDFLDHDKQKIVYLGQASYETESGSSVESLYENEELIADKNQNDRIEKTRRNKYEFIDGSLKIHIVENQIVNVDGEVVTTAPTVTIDFNGAKVVMASGIVSVQSDGLIGDIKFGTVELMDFLKNIKVVGNLGALAPLDPTLITLLQTAISTATEVTIGT
jgi:hypothetical protein